jgi:RNA polymerase sigma-70 factor (ECF subfamily)
MGSFAEIFGEHGRYVWRALRYLGVRDSDLADVCQEVFLVVHRKLPEFEGRSSVRTWLYAIAVKVAADYRKSAYVRREQVRADVPERVSPSNADETEARQLLTRLLDTLDEDKREVIVLSDLEGLSVKEIASVLGCPVQTVYTRLHTARERIQRAARRLELGGRTG